MSDRHVLVTDTLHQQQATVERQAGVTVTHEDLRLVKTAISTAPGVFAYVNDLSPTFWPSTASSRAVGGSLAAADRVPRGGVGRRVVIVDGVGQCVRR